MKIDLWSIWEFVAWKLNWKDEQLDNCEKMLRKDWKIIVKIIVPFMFDETEK